MTILAISGSLRQGSLNTKLLHAAVELAPAGTTIEVGTIRGIPLYDGDLEAASGIPAEVTALKQRVIEADGVLLVTPEYNASIPGVLKNAIDWLSRPPAEIAKVFGGKPFAIMGATPGQGGTILSQAALLPVLRKLGTQPWFGASLMVSGADKVFDDKGALTDDRIRGQLTKFLAGFAKFIGER